MSAKNYVEDDLTLCICYREFDENIAHCRLETENGVVVNAKSEIQNGAVADAFKSAKEAAVSLLWDLEELEVKLHPTY